MMLFLNTPILRVRNRFGRVARERSKRYLCMIAMEERKKKLEKCPVHSQSLREFTGTKEEIEEEEKPIVRTRRASFGNTSITGAPNRAGVLDGIVRASMDPVVITNGHGKILAVNQECLNLFGYRRWELATKNVKVLMPPQVAKHHDKYMSRYNRTGVKKIIGEKRSGSGINGRKKDGSIFPITLKVVEITESKFGSVFLGTIRDDSERFKLQNITKTFESLYPSTEIEKKVYLGATKISRSFNTTVGFIDVCGFTKRSEEIPPEILVQFLGRLFSRIDEFAEQMDMIKIKTIGDCYMFTTNAKEMAFHENGALKAIGFCRKVMNTLSCSPELVEGMETEFGDPLPLHIGIATGRVTGGVLEGKVRTYDVWGAPCNLGARLLECARHGEIMVDRNSMEMTSFVVDYESSVCRLEGIGEIEGFKLLRFKTESHESSGERNRHPVHHHLSPKKSARQTRTRRVSKKKGVVLESQTNSNGNNEEKSHVVGKKKNSGRRHHPSASTSSHHQGGNRRVTNRQGRRKSPNAMSHQQQSSFLPKLRTHIDIKHNEH